MSFPNIWNHRKVADTSAKACEVCFKPSTSVLITQESKDFFYVCPSHLKDRGFCSPIIDQEAVAAKKKKEMDEELERAKKEYEEKQRKKKEKESKSAKDSDKTKDNDEKDTKKDDKKDDPKPDSKDKTDDKTPPKPEEEEPRVFSLQRTFYQQRLDKKRQIEMAKRNRERLSNPNFFPSVPKNLP
ncbi:DUF1742-domain-containing protein [Annulohypoxylon maeteangense]|uniref:DUF1742-domain-containing protein n=1 Tax=Annulohypoxylon maeteangense TaxID=1927788 RepID=UPI00200763A8|nr:DUF1742-domain-containing protein [Annulohypoxylon maeteangense]KAI0885393.1 DUF1742-domain-containing protein [Annulohypoxylon maeteangense]